jgi:hypothetical protein
MIPRAPHRVDEIAHLERADEENGIKHSHRGREKSVDNL